MYDYDYTAIIHVGTAPYDKIARFGFGLAQFARDYPNVHFDWDEALYADDHDDENEDDDGGKLVADDIEVFEKDLNWATFLVRFKTEAERNFYERYRTGKVVGSPMYKILKQLDLKLAD